MRIKIWLWCAKTHSAVWISMLLHGPLVVMGLFSACIWAVEWILSLCRSEIAWPADNHTLLIACPKYRQPKWDIPRRFQIGVISVLRKLDWHRHLHLPVCSEAGNSLPKWQTTLKLEFCCFCHSPFISPYFSCQTLHVWGWSCVCHYFICMSLLIFLSQIFPFY